MVTADGTQYELKAETYKLVLFIHGILVLKGIKN